MSKTQRGCIPWLFEGVNANAAAHGPLGANGRAIGTLVAHNVQAIVDFSHSPAEPARGMDDGCPAEVAIRAIRLVRDTQFDGDGMHLVVDAGYDLLELLPEREVEQMEDMLIARAQNKERA